MSWSELPLRSLVALFGIPLLLICSIAGGVFFFCLVAVLTLLSLWELARLFAPEKGAGPIRIVGSTGAVALLLDAWLWGGVHWGWLLLAGTGLILVVEVFRHDPQPVAVIGGTATSWLYLTIPFAHFLWLRGAPGIIGPVPGGGAWLVVALWLLVWSSDTAAYFIGVAWGRHRLLPSVSPNKTWEGTVGGLLAAAVTGAVLAALISELEWGLPKGVFIGLLIGVAAVLGDLAESRLKRGAGVKDVGKLLPGHGGVLDRFDSTLFSVPILYYVLMA